MPPPDPSALCVILLFPLALLLPVFVCVDCVNQSPSYVNLSYFSKRHRSKNSNNKTTNPQLTRFRFPLQTNWEIITIHLY